jgi:hypothetical protein
MTKKKCNVSLTPEDINALNEYAGTFRLGSANALLAVVAGELVKAKERNLNFWHVLGRIAKEETESERKNLPSPRGAVQIAQ